MLLVLKGTVRVLILKIVLVNGLLNILTVYAPHSGKPKEISRVSTLGLVLWLFLAFGAGNQRFCDLTVRVAEALDLGVNGIEAVSSRPMTVCRPMNHTCIVVEVQMLTELILFMYKISTLW